jgi:hypothetical protein
MSLIPMFIVYTLFCIMVSLAVVGVISIIGDCKCKDN